MKTKDMEDMKVLTVKKAQGLVGKTIYWTYIPYKFNEQIYETTLIGNIVKESDWAKTQPCNGYDSRWDYWIKELQKDAERAENTLLLLDDNGETTGIKAYCGKYDMFGYPEPTFTCSDADREVYYEEIDLCDDLYKGIMLYDVLNKFPYLDKIRMLLKNPRLPEFLNAEDIDELFSIKETGEDFLIKTQYTDEVIVYETNNYYLVNGNLGLGFCQYPKADWTLQDAVDDQVAEEEQ